ncbi:MAG: sulfurtransferase [Candidatus Marinimicrobia bacterium]|nr:sulfurtransferase [Candidatus Neomarinimicrobiota bacterium]
MQLFKHISIFLCIGIFIVCGNHSVTIESKDAMMFLDDVNYYFLDVRTIKEHKNKSIPSTDCIPVQELEQRIDELNKHRNKKIIVYCRSGNRSSTAVKILNNSGFSAFNMIGGMNGWKGETIKKNI